MVVCKEKNTTVDEGSKLKPLSLEITVLPNKLEYFGKKDELDVTGGKVKLSYERKITRTYELQTENVSGFDNTVVGKQILTVTIDGATATFEVEIVTATVVFKNYDDSIISSAEYMYGDKIAVPADPVRESNGIYTYTFAGWDKAVIDCVGDAVYTATYVMEGPDGVIPGDATGDGNVNALDLVRLKKFLSGADVTFDAAGADATGDGNVDARDLVRLKKYLSGADVTLG